MSVPVFLFCLCTRVRDPKSSRTVVGYHECDFYFSANIAFPAPSSLSFLGCCFGQPSATAQRTRGGPGGRRAGEAAGGGNRASESRTVPAKREAGPHVPAGERMQMAEIPIFISFDA